VKNRFTKHSAEQAVALPLSLGLLLALACSFLTPVPTQTAIPTWALPARMTATALSEGAIPATALPTVAPAGPGSPSPGPAGPLPTPTLRPDIDPTLWPATPDPSETPSTPIPEAMPLLRMDPSVTNILLLGRDTPRESRAYRTDVMIVVSINRAAESVTLITIPRDLFVYIPGWTMNRINTAAAHGDSIGYPGGGVALLEQTILYNLGIPIHGWARIDFDGFKEVVDILDGVDVPVSCAIQEWRLKDPGLDQQNADNWELYTLQTGVQHLDGDLALWYARSRLRSSDFDRSRRQHQVLRAIFDKALQLNVLPKVPELYAQYVRIVDTDLGANDLLGLAPFAATLDQSRIKSRFIGRDHVTSWRTPAGAAVLLPRREAIAPLLQEAFLPPSENVARREAPAIEIWNGSGDPDMAALAADNLAWAGLTPVLGEAGGETIATTTIYDYTTSPKGSALSELQRLFKVSNANVIATPNAAAPYPFRVVLGADYNPCVGPPPQIVATPTPGAAPAGTPDPAVHAARVTSPPPGVDGDLVEWTSLVYPISEPAFGNSNWLGPDDLSAAWNIAWDDGYLYIALDVRDDAFVQQANNVNLFRGDSLELLIDADLSDAAQRSLNADDFQLGISPGNLAVSPDTPEAWLWYPRSEARAITGVLVGAALVEGGYHLEVAVPWEIFHITPSAGQRLGFALSLNDDDTPEGAQQESVVSNVRGRLLTDPGTWGVLVLDGVP
jgi:LCP family protein required for cell wall assembly